MILEVSDVVKNYGLIEVLKDVSFSVDEGEILAIIGPNGAGKTTLFRALTGEALPNSGSISYRGKDITRIPAFQRVALGFGRTFQVARVFPEFTVAENVMISLEALARTRDGNPLVGFGFGRRKGIVAGAERILEMLKLTRLAKTEARYLSHGDKKRLELAVVLAGEPKVIMLDEPTAGMSPPDRIGITELLQSLRQELGLTMLLTEHDMDLVFALADRVLMLNYGQVVAFGTKEEIRQSPIVREIYLGKEDGADA